MGGIEIIFQWGYLIWGGRMITHHHSGLDPGESHDAASGSPKWICWLGKLEMLLKNILRKCHGQKMLFYLFLGPLEGLKSRPFHHCLFSSDLARPKKKIFLRAQTNCSWPPAYFSFSTSLLRNALLICRMTWSGCGTNWSATSCPQMFHRITKSPWMAAIFRKSDVKAKHLRRPAMTKYSQGG